MGKCKFILIVFIVSGLTPFAHAQQLSHEEELKCLATIYVQNVFGDEKPKGPPTGGWSVSTPGEAVSPFESGEYLPKLERIKAAAKAGNIYASYVLGEMYLSGVCVPGDSDLGEEYMDKARAYVSMSEGALFGLATQGKDKEAVRSAYVFLKIAILKYPYVNEESARVVLVDKGNKSPTDQELREFVNRLQPSKEELEKKLNHLVDIAQLSQLITKDEFKELDDEAEEWIKKYP